MKTDSNRIAMSKVCLMYFFYNFFWSLSSGSLSSVWLNDTVGIGGSKIGVLFGFQTVNNITTAMAAPVMGMLYDSQGFAWSYIYFGLFAAVATLIAMVTLSSKKSVKVENESDLLTV
ncbi:MFS transporter [Vibrio sp. A1-b2]|uniref:MFS transporter n=1 Tax=Vibrio sp. A1-b2 TaxID=2912248 RepID=UPI001F005C1A|nr:MFS transporter [Vibrio sp. A1-b2]MCF7364433.1 MFS transporter [Vibrio sp. A1-b2]